MIRMFNRLVGAALVVACLVSAASAEARDPQRPVTVDDIVALASFGRGAFSPDGRWAVYEKRGAYDSIARYDYAHRSTWTIMDLWVADLSRPSEPPQRLLPGEGPGIQKVAFSASGERLLVSRLRGDRFEYGVATLADRSVEWTGLTPDIPRAGASADWLSDDEVVLLIRPDHSLPDTLRLDGGAQPRTAAAWERTAEGREPSRTIVDAEGGVASAETPGSVTALVSLDLATGERRVLVEGRITDFAVAPDRRWIAVVSRAVGAPMSEGAVLQGGRPDRQRLRFVRLEDGAVSQPMETYDVAPHLLRWSPEGGVLVWARADGAAWTDGALMQASPDGVAMMDIGELTPGAAADILAGVGADWLGDAPVLYARPAQGERFDWFLLAPGGAPRMLTAALAAPPSRMATAGRGVLSFFADGGFWSMTSTGVRRLTPVDQSVRAAPVADQEQVTRLRFEAPRRAWTPAIGSDGKSLILDADGGVRRLGPTKGRLDDRLLAVSVEGVLTVDRTGLSETLRLRREHGEDVLDRINTGLKNVVLTQPISVSHADHQGRPTRSWLFLPSDRAPSEVRGLIVKLYPGATDSWVWYDPLNLTTGIRPQVLAGAGFAVLSPSVPGDAPVAERGDIYLQSVDLAVDAALAAFPGLPEDRMAVLGHSFGGYAALEIAGRTDRYRSYVASAALSDLFGFWGEFHPGTRIQPEDGTLFRAAQGWTETGQGGMTTPPWADPGAYAAASPYLRADRITAPLLLLTADMDFVPMNQAERMFSARLRQGGRARIVTYWGEHHNLWSPANIRDRYEQIFRWLDETLNGARP